MVGILAVSVVFYTIKPTSVGLANAADTDSWFKNDVVLTLLLDQKTISGHLESFLETCSATQVREDATLYDLYHRREIRRNRYQGALWPAFPSPMLSTNSLAAVPRGSLSNTDVRTLIVFVRRIRTMRRPFPSRPRLVERSKQPRALKTMLRFENRIQITTMGQLLHLATPSLFVTSARDNKARLILADSRGSEHCPNSGIYINSYGVSWLGDPLTLVNSGLMVVCR